jgi:archaemetzincin
MTKHPFLGLVALGPIDPEILRRLCTNIAKFLKLPVRVLPPQPLPAQTYHLTRHQYNSTQLLEFILDHGETEAFRILGVTSGDLYIPILTFVFGEAQVNGKAAIISLFRPRGDPDGTPPSRTVLLERLTKLGLHELGHTFGLGHCREDGCLMGFSSNLEKLDQTGIALCDYCQVLMTDFFLDQGLQPPFKGYAETPAQVASNPDAGNSRKRRQ